MSEVRLSKPVASCFGLAAWYSLVIPFVAALSWFAFVSANGVSNTSGMVWFFAELSSFDFGVLSLFGIPAHGYKRILAKAVVGIVASVFFGWCALMFWGQSWPG